MSQIHSCLLIAILLMSCAGCSHSEPTFTDHSQDVEMYVQNLRRLLEAQVSLALKGDAELHLAPVVLELQHNDRPVGEYREIVMKLREKTTLVFDACRAGEPKQKLKSDLNALLALSRSLPEGNQVKMTK